MPKEFEQCVNEGGDMFTATGKKKEDREKYGLEEDQFQHMCRDKEGNLHKGEIKKRKSPTN